MMKFFLRMMTLSLLSCHALSAELSTPEALFKRFVELGENFDPAVANLYADDAKIVFFRQHPHGLERQMAVSGYEWKSLISKIMPVAKLTQDISRYQEVEVIAQDDAFKIKANRYVERKCYWDAGYYMMVKKSPSGQWLIIEEYTQTQPTSQC
ncbi:hypothetical protein [Marinagarivorans algicola]|uniref:hypothetical protein n=1 Tax=Marinagarivorans algicola TaxID=1513270 RepID=UPI0012E2D6D7|nr:hypothetical protein [Marinagarivorans algicola]